jgi:hypothetical protein
MKKRITSPMTNQKAPLTIKPKLSIRLTGQRAGFMGNTENGATASADLSGLALDCTGLVSPLDASVQKPTIAQPDRFANALLHAYGATKRLAQRVLWRPRR